MRPRTKTARTLPMRRRRRARRRSLSSDCPTLPGGTWKVSPSRHPNPALRETDVRPPEGSESFLCRTAVLFSSAIASSFEAAGGEVLAVGCVREVLADQPGYEE